MCTLYMLDWYNRTYVYPQPYVYPPLLYPQLLGPNASDPHNPLWPNQHHGPGHGRIDNMIELVCLCLPFKKI